MTRLATVRVPVGARRRRFVLERPLDTPDGFGGHLRRFVAGPVLWGALTPLGSRDEVRGAGAQTSITHRLDLRYRDGLGPPMRVVAGSRRFAIRTAIDPDGRRRDLVCEVEEVMENAA